MHCSFPARISALAAGVALATLMSHAAVAEEWKFAIEEIEGSVQDAYAQEFKKRIEEKTNGEVTVTVYPYGTLGTSAELTELVTQGAIQFANASPGHLGTMVPEIQVFSIPYLLSENNEVNKQVLTSSDVIYDKLQKDFNAKGLQLLTMYPEGEMVWTTDKEIHSPADFDNFKMRTMVSPMLVTAYEAFGASPTPMPYGEVYGGLQLKQIDGQVNPIFAIEEMKFYEVTDYMIWAGRAAVHDHRGHQQRLVSGRPVGRAQADPGRDRRRAGRLHLQGAGRVQPGAPREDQAGKARHEDDQAVARGAAGVRRAGAAGPRQVRRDGRPAGQGGAERRSSPRSRPPRRSTASS